MVQSTQAQSGQRTHKVRGYIQWIEFAIIWEQCFDCFRAESQTECYQYKCEIEGSAASGVEDPVEGYGEDEKYDGVKRLIVHLRNLNGSEFQVCGEKDEETKSTY